MDFSLNELQSMLLDSVQRYLDTSYDFDARQRYAGSDAGYSAEVWSTFAELGWTAIPFPEDDGGLDGGAVEMAVVMEQFGRRLVVEPYLATIILAGGVLKRVTSGAVREALLHPLIAGERQAALAFVEPQSRYDLANVATTATRQDGGWRISGHKGVVINGGNAELLIVPARIDGAQNAREGIGLFAVDASLDGIAVRHYPTVDGQQAAELSLDCSVDETSLLTDDGIDVLEAAIDDATLAVSAEAIGIMRILTEKTVEYTKSRKQFGVPIGTFQALQHRMVDMFTACEQSYSLLVWAATCIDAGDKDARRALSAVKYQIGTAGRKVGQEAVQLHGGMGVTWELDVAHYFKRLTVIDTLFGNADLHLDRLAA